MNKDYIKPSKKYTPASGCIISEKNGYRESLTAQKRLEVYLPDPVGSDNLIPAVLLPANLTMAELLNLRIYGINKEPNGLYPFATSINSVQKKVVGHPEAFLVRSTEDNFIYDPNTGVFVSIPVMASEEAGFESFEEVYKAMIDETEDSGKAIGKPVPDLSGGGSNPGLS